MLVCSDVEYCLLKNSNNFILGRKKQGVICNHSANLVINPVIQQTTHMSKSLVCLRYGDCLGADGELRRHPKLKGAPDIFSKEYIIMHLWTMYLLACQGAS